MGFGTDVGRGELMHLLNLFFSITKIPRAVRLQDTPNGMLKILPVALSTSLVAQSTLFFCRSHLALWELSFLGPHANWQKLPKQVRCLHCFPQ